MSVLKRVFLVTVIIICIFFNFSYAIDENQLTYEYNTMNLDDNNSVEEIFLKILDYCLKNPIKSASNTTQQEQVVDKSCNIFLHAFFSPTPSLLFTVAICRVRLKVAKSGNTAKLEIPKLDASTL